LTEITSVALTSLGGGRNKKKVLVVLGRGGNFIRMKQFILHPVIEHHSQSVGGYGISFEFFYFSWLWQRVP